MKFLGVVHRWDMREEKLKIKQPMEIEMDMEEGRTSICEQQDETMVDGGDEDDLQAGRLACARSRLAGPT